MHIRYKSLPSGMHAEALRADGVRNEAGHNGAGQDKATRGARGVVVYLVPGLSSAQRRAALRRLRQEGSRGCGPGLPAGELAVALAADRIRVGFRYTTAAVRLHPVSMLVSAVLAGGLLASFMFVSVTVRVAPVANPAAQAAAGLPASAARATGAASASALVGKSRGHAARRRSAAGRRSAANRGPAARKPAPSPICVASVGGCPRP
jgi:hypothetical protein